jgi:non-ribosomal peptide synthetase component F
MTHLRLQNSICVHQLVADQAAKSPDAVAVVAGERTLTYRAWEDRANRLAESLRRVFETVGEIRDQTETVGNDEA